VFFHYHTASYIFAVANGYCKAVYSRDGKECPLSLVGAKLVGVAEQMFCGEIVPEGSIKAGQRLKFEVGSACLMTDRLVLVENVNSLSLPPVPRISTVPGSDPRLQIPTLPEIFLPDDQVEEGKE